MHPQLQAVTEEFEGALDRLHALAHAVPESRWSDRPDPARWSVAECVAHLNLTSMAYIPLLQEGIADAQGLAGEAPRRYRRDWAGWLLWKSAGPPVRFRVKTTAPFVPEALETPAALVTGFERLQGIQLDLVRDADGLRIDRVRVVSPFDARLSYNLYACLTILPRHQHRHLWQAEQAWRSL